LSGLSAYLPLALFAAFVCWDSLVAGLFFLLKNWVSEESARIVSLPLTTIVVVTGLVLYIRFVGRRLSQCHLELTDDALKIRGQTSSGLKSMSYPLSDIQYVALGGRLNLAERLSDRLNQLGVARASGIQINKGGQFQGLLVGNRGGAVTVFHFVDKAFDRESLLDLLAELAHRGVHVEVVT
jgi:hypothetical protein